MQNSRECHDVLGLSKKRPRQPAHEPMDRIAILRFVECCLGCGPLEGVTPVPETVRPRSQHLSATVCASSRYVESVDHVVTG